VPDLIAAVPADPGVVSDAGTASVEALASAATPTGGETVNVSALAGRTAASLAGTANPVRVAQAAMVATAIKATRCKARIGTI
jgi:hypothetical protein